MGFDGVNYYSENEITTPVNLCSESGRLNRESIGWSRNTIYKCNLSGRWPRKKKWNYWCITNNECLFSVTISNVDYLANIFAYFFDFNTKKFIEKTIMVPLGLGCNMPDSVHETVIFKNNKINIEFIENNGSTKISVICKDFGGLNMSSDFNVIYPDNHETLNVVVPWSNRLFQFTSKHEALPVEGTLNVGDRTYYFKQNDTFACLDFGRGIWPYQTSWNWANCSGITGGHSVGLNLGGKWTDGTGMTENAIVVDGKITKLSEDIIFDYDSKNLMKPWKLRTAISNRVDLVFTPIFDRIAKTDIIILKSIVHQLIGYFYGEIKTDSGDIIKIDNLTGCSEEHFGRW